MKRDRRITTRRVAELLDLANSGRLVLAPEYQRESVWPHAARATLIDSILDDLPVPMLIFQHALLSRSGRSGYSVIDGQQRLRAVFDFAENKFRLTRSDAARLRNKRFANLGAADQRALLEYPFIVEELSGYSSRDVIELFERMNKYAVKLSRQELRHARGQGQFHDWVERVGRWTWWSDHRVFSKNQLRRMRAIEFVAEIAILLLEGPTDKKEAIDNYYAKYSSQFAEGKRMEIRLLAYLKWIEGVLPKLSASRFRKPVDLYGLIGAIDSRLEDRALKTLNPVGTAQALVEFETALRKPTGVRARYVEAASRQTDNIGPRMTRIKILTELIR